VSINSNWQQEFNPDQILDFGCYIPIQNLKLHGCLNYQLPRKWVKSLSFKRKEPKKYSLFNPLDLSSGNTFDL
jgi:hypothetical protein